MKEKVLALLKPLLANKGFKKAELEGLAEIAAKNLTDASTEEEINNVVNGIVPYADLMQKIGNRYASETDKKYEGWVKPESNPAPQPTPTTPQPAPDNTPKAPTAEDIQRMIAEKVAESLKPYQEREEKSRLQNLLFSNEKVKKIPEQFRNKYSLDKEENLETVATQIESDYAAMKQELLKSGEFVAPPQGGSGASETDDLISALHAMGEKATATK